MTADVERVWAVIERVLIGGNGGHIDKNAVARAAMAATREIDAEDLRAEVVPRGATYEARMGVEVAADWLQQRANDVKETGRG